eukprot:scaffold189011_cov12-Tisochrysis_lutea.AAC.1
MQPQQRQLHQGDDEEEEVVEVMDAGGQGTSDGRVPAKARRAGLQEGDGVTQHTPQQTAPQSPQPPVPQRVNLKCDAAR